MSNILFLGGSGFIGREIIPFLKKDNHSVTAPCSFELNLTDKHNVDNFFCDKFYDVIIYSAINGRKTHLENNWDVFYENMLMFELLFRHKNKTKLFLNIDSGASLQEDFEKYPYSFSKFCISERINLEINAINLRLWGCFGPTEESKRFFVGNIERYINRENMIIHQDRQMDFIYIKDFYKIIDYVIQNKDNNTSKNINCVYDDKYRLSDICNVINKLDRHEVKIIIQDETLGNNYITIPTSLPIKFEGLHKGIYNCFNYLRLKNV